MKECGDLRNGVLVNTTDLDLMITSLSDQMKAGSNFKKFEGVSAIGAAVILGPRKGLLFTLISFRPIMSNLN